MASILCRAILLIGIFGYVYGQYPEIDVSSQRIGTTSRPRYQRLQNARVNAVPNHQQQQQQVFNPALGATRTRRPIPLSRPRAAINAPEYPGFTSARPKPIYSSSSLPAVPLITAIKEPSNIAHNNNNNQQQAKQQQIKHQELETVKPVSEETEEEEEDVAQAIANLGAVSNFANQQQTAGNLVSGPLTPKPDLGGAIQYRGGTSLPYLLSRPTTTTVPPDNQNSNVPPIQYRPQKPLKLRKSHPIIEDVPTAENRGSNPANNKQTQQSNNQQTQKQSFPQNNLRRVITTDNQRENREKYPETREKYPETRQKYPETQQKYPETQQKYPETRQKYPETRDKYPETQQKYPETRQKYPETRDKYPETQQKYPETRQKYPETREKYTETREKSTEYRNNKNKPVAQIIRRWREDNEDGSITWGFENDDGSYKEELIGVDCITRGKYGYIDLEGYRREYSYETGIKCDEDQLEDEKENGFVDYQENKLVLPNGKTIDLSTMGKKQTRRPQPIYH